MMTGDSDPIAWSWQCKKLFEIKELVVNQFWKQRRKFVNQNRLSIKINSDFKLCVSELISK